MTTQAAREINPGPGNNFARFGAGPGMPFMPHPNIPPNASPQLQDYLTARGQIMRDQIAFMNQHRTDDPAARQAAMQQWREQNTPRFQQVQQLAQATTTISNATTTQ
jgi:hypothetical protein